MNIRAYHQLLAALLVGLFSVPAIAQFSRDASANKKIDEAINNHYLMMQLDKAESLLTGTVSACEDKCSPATKAKAWMYVGIVRGSGKNDQSGAAEAFATAKGLDPSVKLDEALATPETKTTFDGTAGGASSEPDPVSDPMPTDSGSAPGAAPPPAGVPGDMLCSPQGADIQTNMPIPVSCSSDAAVVEGFIKFKEPGGSDWKKIAMSEVNGQWQAEIPCKFTTSTGELQFYIGMKDGSGEYVDQFGSKKAPASFTISDSGVAPAFPGQPPVTSCVATAGSSDCPPDFPGCESNQNTATCGDLDWGASCNNSSQCKCGLLCESGQCATAPTCTADDQCETGSCVDGYCSAVSDGDSAGGPFSRHILSFAAGMDLMPVAGIANLCGADEGFGDSYGIQCYDTESNRRFPEGVDVGSGMAFAQIRLKLGYDFAISEHLLLGARVGFAFMNSHPSAENEPAYLPLHIEARGTYNFTSIAKKGLQAGLYLGGGFAEANAKLVVDETEIYKVAGRGFGALGGTLGYAFAPNVAVNLDLQGMFLLPAGGITPVIHPALSFVYGL